MYGVVSDGASVYWSEYNVNLGLSTIFARAADGSGSVRTVMEAGALPTGEIVLDLVADNDALYGLLRTDTNDEFPQNHTIVRIPKDGGPPTGLLNSGQGRSFFFPTLGENLICALRDIDFVEPADIFCVGKTGENPVQLTDTAFSLVGVEGDEAIVVDAGGDIEYLKRASSSQGTQSRPLLPSDANPRPLPVEGTFDGEAYYFLTSGLLKSLPRSGPSEFTLLSTGEAQQTRALRVEDGALYWLNLRGGFIADVRTVPKVGGAVQTLVETVSSDALSVRDGVAYWISPDFTTLFGRRLQLSPAGGGRSGVRRPDGPGPRRFRSARRSPVWGFDGRADVQKRKAPQRVACEAFQE